MLRLRKREDKRGSSSQSEMRVSVCCNASQFRLPAVLYRASLLRWWLHIIYDCYCSVLIVSPSVIAQYTIGPILRVHDILDLQQVVPACATVVLVI